MININFVGRLGADAQVKTSRDGKQYLSFSIVTDVYNNKTKQAEGVWFQATIFDDNLVSRFNGRLTKGSQVFVSGTESVRLWQKQNNEYAIARDITINNMDYVSSRKSETENAVEDVTSSVATTAQITVDCGTLTPPTPSQTVASLASAAADDDLPF